jgi:hypothetical protein
MYVRPEGKSMKLNFNKGLLLICAFLLLGSSANATPVTCGGAQDVLALGFSCTFENLLFSSFSLVNAGGSPKGSMNLVSAALVGEEVHLNFNPSLAVPADGIADSWFYFQVDGAVDGIDLGVGGTGASITERVCSTPIDVNNGNTCTAGMGNQLAALTISSGNASGVVSFPGGAVTQLYVFKNILLQGPPTGPAELSSFSESFSRVPEPLSLVLMGSGLLGFGIFKRRKH